MLRGQQVCGTQAWLTRMAHAHGSRAVNAGTGTSLSVQVEIGALLGLGKNAGFNRIYEHVLKRTALTNSRLSPRDHLGWLRRVKRPGGLRFQSRQLPHIDRPRHR